jgi:hypothetical protein
MRFKTGQPHHAIYEDLVNHIWIHAGNNHVTNSGNNPV